MNTSEKDKLMDLCREIIKDGNWKMQTMDCQGMKTVVFMRDEMLDWKYWEDTLPSQLLKKPKTTRYPFGMSWKKPVGSDFDGDVYDLNKHENRTADKIFNDAIKAMREYKRKEPEKVNGYCMMGPSYSKIGMEDRGPLDQGLGMTYAYLKNAYGVKDIIFNPPATIVFWNDGTKTIVKCTKGAEFNPYYGFCAAVCKKMYSSNSQLNKMISEQWEISKKKLSKSVLEDIEKSGKTVKKQKEKQKNG